MNDPGETSSLGGQAADVRNAFRERGLRLTRQREVIYSALAATKLHPTAEELFSSVRGFEPGLSLATVYNTLEALTRCGLARRIPSELANGPCRFDADTSPHVHATTADGRVVDLPAQMGAALLSGVPADDLRRLERELGVRVSRLSIELPD